ncbi:hypothetical protein MA9V2_185 [Chryseobacterium phage MA9V-2]|nr:hypothetical protein MA9V2_185 [Chryseobacterium phage MA9V-2]
MSTIANLTIEQKRTLLAQLYRSESNTEADKVRLDELMHDQATFLKTDNPNLYVKACLIPNHDDDVVFYDGEWHVVDFDTYDGVIQNFIVVDGKIINLEY